MSLTEWLLIGGAAWLLKKGISATDGEHEKAEAEMSQLLAEIDQATKLHTKNRIEAERRAAVEAKRRKTPCSFSDGISQDEFSSLAKKIAKKIKRIKEINIDGPRISCTVESQTGFTNWSFGFDYNNWGHINGTRWPWTENYDSSIPAHYGQMLTGEIHRLLEEKNITLRDFSDSVDENTTLETANALGFSKKISFFRKVFFKERGFYCHYDWNELLGEHLYPVISLLKDDGFCNIKAIPIMDVGRDSNHFVFEVEQVVINGSDYFKLGHYFSERSEVVITYHDKQEIELPFSARQCKKRNYTEVVDKLYDLGFTEIIEVPVKDLVTGWVKKDGSIEEISIAGETDFRKGTVFKFDKKIQITYHTFKRSR